jgi:hypothetical protein
MDEFYDMTGALLRAMAGLLDSSVQDKGPQIAGALGEFIATRIEGGTSDTAEAWIGRGEAQ